MVRHEKIPSVFADVFPRWCARLAEVLVYLGDYPFPAATWFTAPLSTEQLALSSCGGAAHFGFQNTNAERMIPAFPLWIALMFLLTVALTILLFHRLNGRPWRLTALILGWAGLQSAVALTGFYQTTDTLPPRFALVLLPVLAALIYGLLPGRRRALLAGVERRNSIFLHTVRIPVEIALYYLFLHGFVPELMTFSGRNFDILAGITAPLVGWFYARRQLSDRGLLVWNFAGLALVLFIVANGILSAELPFQQLAFEQPNRAVNYFPFILLPAVIVPLVIYTHLLDLLWLWPRATAAVGQVRPGDDQQAAAAQQEEEMVERKQG